MSEKIKYPIYDLTPKEFEELSLELLSATEKYKNLRLSTDQNDYLFCDIYGEFITEKDNTVNVAIEVKHWLKFNVGNFKNEVTRRIDRIKDLSYVQFVTSAKIENHQKDQINDIISPYSSYGFQLYDQDDIIILLDENPKIADKYFQPVIDKNKRQWMNILISIIAVILGVFVNLISTSVFNTENNSDNKNPLDIRIDRVENAIVNLKDLEHYLEELKDEMGKTSKDVARIKNEYETVQKLKELSDEELALLNTALSKREWYETPLKYFLGFILGVASSIIGSIVIERLKLRKQLQS